MNKPIVEEWIAALRSGKYAQTTGQLHDNNGFCCLGVLCDIVKDRVGMEWDQRALHTFVFAGKEDALAKLPKAVTELVGCDDRGTFHAYQPDLIYINDIGGGGFDKIADILERELKR